MSVAGVAATVVTGAVFIAAGFSKVRSPHWSVLALDAGTPRLVIVTLPAAEAMLGLALVVQLAPAVFPWIAVALLAAFTGVVVYRLASGSKAPCNCFGGSANDPVTVTTVVRNLALMAIALVGAIA